MQSKGVPRKGDLQYSLDLGQNDPVHARQKHLNLTISRTNRRKSIEDNIFISNMKFMTSESNPAFSKDFDKGQDTERFKTNTFSSRLQEDETNITSDLKPRTLFNKSQLSPDLNNVKTGARILGSHNRYSNRSFDNGQRYSPPPEVTYKKYVGDISLISKGNSNILLIISNRLVRLRFTSSLKKSFSCNLIEADSLHEAFSESEGKHIDYIILESSVTQSATILMIRQIKRKFNLMSCPILISAENIDKDMLTDLAKFGNIDFILSPFNSEKLNNKISKYIGKQI